MARVQPTVFGDAEELGRCLAGLIGAGLAAATEAGKPYLLGCPGGRSAMSTYVALAAEVGRRRLDLSRLVIVMMDEYLDADLAPVSASAAHSCARFGRVEIVGRLNAAAGPGQGISPDRLWIPDPADPARYDRCIADAGGVDLFILASGASDGHIAFNPAGTPADARTRVVPLAEETRRDNLTTFPSFGGNLANVPGYGITVGVGTIRDHSKRVAMVVHGADKRRTVARLRAAEHYEPDWPATIVTDCTDPLFFVDAVAAHISGGE